MAAPILGELTPEEESQVTKTTDYYDRLMYRVKGTNRPKLPGSASEIELTEEYINYDHFKNGPTKFLLVDSSRNGERIMIFATENSLRKMAECDKSSGDGTFKQAPKFFEQLYTIHGYYEGQWVFGILPNKKEVTYVRFLRLFQAQMDEIGVQFKVGQFQIDFKLATINAIWGVIKCEVKGCSFHFCSSLIHQTQKLGLSTRYKKDTITRKIVRHSMALLHLKPEEIEEAFELVAAMANDESDDNIRAKIVEFIKYMIKN